MDLKHEILETQYREKSITNPYYEEKDLRAISDQMKDAYKSFPGHKIEKIPAGSSGIKGPINFATRFLKRNIKKEN